MASSLTMMGYQHFNEILDFSSKQLMLRFSFVIISIFCLFIMIFQFILDKSVLNRTLYIIEGQAVKKSKKLKPSFNEGIRLMFKSKLVLSVCGIVLAYKIGTNMVEPSYKSCLKIVSIAGKKDTGNHVLFMSSLIQFITGSVVIALLITPFSRSIQNRGWKFIGIIPPIIATAGFVLVFSLATFNTGTNKENLTIFNNLFQTIMDDEKKIHFLKIEEYVCLFTVALFKICKYAAFDIAKETLSMKINKKYRARFKGIYDGVCGKLGKAGGAFLLIVSNQVVNTTDIRRASFFYLIISIALVFVWFYIVCYLARKYDESVKLNKDIDIDLFKGTKKIFSDDENEYVLESADDSK